MSHLGNSLVIVVLVADLTGHLLLSPVSAVFEASSLLVYLLLLRFHFLLFLFHLLLHSTAANGGKCFLDVAVLQNLSYFN